MARDEQKRKEANKALDEYIPLTGKLGKGVQSGDRSNIILQREIGLLLKDYLEDWVNKPDASAK